MLFITSNQFIIFIRFLNEVWGLRPVDAREAPLSAGARLPAPLPTGPGAGGGVRAVRAEPVRGAAGLRAL